jgi:glycosyltransferase involved in cell wall biosynthesis
MQSPLATVAVVIPAFNHERFVVDAVQSALAQTCTVREIVVVDDGSTDGTAEAVRGIRDPRLRLICQTNGGPSAARNRGCHATSSDWIQFLDADDMLPPGAIHDLLTTATRKPTTLPYGRESVYPEKITGAPAFVATMAERDGNLLSDIALSYRGTIYASLIPRTLIEEVGGHDEATHFGEDYDFALALATRREFSFTGTSTYTRRMHGTNRHRSYDAAAEQQFFASLRRRLGPEHRRLCRLATASRAWEFGTRRLSAGEFPAARCLFLRALRNNPTKLGAWKGLFRSILGKSG